MRFSVIKDRIIFEDGPSADFLALSAAIHSLVNKQSRLDVTLDFSAVSFLDLKIMVPLVTIARSYRIHQVYFDIVAPRDRKLNNLILNANWAHLITPERFESRDDKNHRHLSAIQYHNDREQYDAVDRTLDTILRSIQGLNRQSLRALEWSLSEVTDNVLNHADSHIGGVLQVMAYQRRKIIELYVCDAGIGIPASLRQGHPLITDHTIALDYAIREGITRNRLTNQGNGLFGAYRCSELSGGEFKIVSGNAMLEYKKGSLRVTRTSVPAKGTFIRMSINYVHEQLLEKAFVFKNMTYDFPNDYIDKTYQKDSDVVHFVMKSEVASFRSRESGRAARTKIENILAFSVERIVFDFDQIDIVSSSFADEVFGKTYAAVGAQRFSASFRFMNINDTVKILVNRAIRQRIDVNNQHNSIPLASSASIVTVDSFE